MSTENPRYFAIIPALVRYSKELTLLQKMLYGELTALSQRFGHCWATNKYFARLYGKDQLTISRAISALQKYGFIDIVTDEVFGRRDMYIRISEDGTLLRTPKDFKDERSKGKTVRKLKRIPTKKEQEQEQARNDSKSFYDENNDENQHGYNKNQGVNIKNVNHNNINSNIINAYDHHNARIRSHHNESTLFKSKDLKSFLTKKGCFASKNQNTFDHDQDHNLLYVLSEQELADLEQYYSLLLSNKLGKKHIVKQLIKKALSFKNVDQKNFVEKALIKDGVVQRAVYPNVDFNENDSSRRFKQKQSATTQDIDDDAAYDAIELGNQDLSTSHDKGKLVKGRKLRKIRREFKPEEKEKIIQKNNKERLKNFREQSKSTKNHTRPLSPSNNTVKRGQETPTGLTTGKTASKPTHDMPTFGAHSKRHYTYSIDDFKLYRQLIALGATEHRLESKAYYHTMDAIHQLISKNCKNPYFRCKQISQDYKDRIWQIDDVLISFEWYIKNDEKLNYRAISQFIYASYNSYKSWSPLVACHKKVKESQGIIESDNPLVLDLLKHLDGIFPLTFDEKGVNVILRNFDEICDGFKVPDSVSGRKNTLFGILLKYISNRCTYSDFKPEYIYGQYFMKRFIFDTHQEGLIAPTNAFIQKLGSRERFNTYIENLRHFKGKKGIQKKDDEERRYTTNLYNW